MCLCVCTYALQINKNISLANKATTLSCVLTTEFFSNLFLIKGRLSGENRRALVSLNVVEVQVEHWAQAVIVFQSMSQC